MNRSEIHKHLHSARYRYTATVKTIPHTAERREPVYELRFPSLCEAGQWVKGWSLGDHVQIPGHVENFTDPVWILYIPPLAVQVSREVTAHG